MEFTLAPPAPYHFARTRHAARALYIAARHMPDGALRRCVRAGEGLALLEMRDKGTTDAPQVRVRVLAVEGAVDETAIRRKAEQIVLTRTDVAGFYAAHADDPMLAESITAQYGLNVLGADTLFEAVALTMIEQQISVKMAQTSESWLMDWVGDGITYHGERYPVFPAPEQIAVCSVEMLVPMKITRVRLGRLIALAREIADDGGAFERLRESHEDAVYERLRRIPGVGHWTAAWSLIRACGVFPYFGAADVALRSAVNRVCLGMDGGRADPATVDAVFAPYGAYAGLASYYVMMRYEGVRYPSIQA
jgi:DNA-3-methyladenine glycosylase II